MSLSMKCHYYSLLHIYGAYEVSKECIKYFKKSEVYSEIYLKKSLKNW